jgi:predicted DNA-binding WGR domain protein
MTTQPYQLYIERIEPHKNMARFYAMSIEATLLGVTSLVRRWGRIGSRGQQKVQLFDTEPEAVNVFLAMARAKRLRGYRPRKGGCSPQVPSVSTLDCGNLKPAPRILCVAQ